MLCTCILLFHYVILVVDTKVGAIRGHPFMTSTRRGEGSQAQVDACGGGVKSHLEDNT